MPISKSLDPHEYQQIQAAQAQGSCVCRLTMPAVCVRPLAHESTYVRVSAPTIDDQYESKVYADEGVSRLSDAGATTRFLDLLHDTDLPILAYVNAT